MKNAAFDRLGRGTFISSCAATIAFLALLGASTSAAAFPGSGFLPDGRAWELVSPPDKVGGNIAPNVTRTRAAVGGDAVQFVSPNGFADAQSTSLAVEYIARRTAHPGTQGWTTHAITPKLDSFSVQNIVQSFYQAELSPDLSKGVFLTPTNLASDPNVGNIANLYLRGDMLQGGNGSYQLLTSCPLCVFESTPLPTSEALARPSLSASTPDFDRFLLQEQRARLTTDAPVNNSWKLYEWDQGALSYAGILPDGTPAPRSIAGARMTLTPRVLSDGSDGHSRVFFTVPDSNGDNFGSVYMRTDATTTVQLNSSERTDCAGDPTCGGNDVPDPAPDPAGPLPAMYETASADGTRVFFTSQEALTDDATEGFHLYLYDASKPDSDPHNLTMLDVDAEPVDGFTNGTPLVLGASEDGDFVYFAQGGTQLVSGGPELQGGSGLYVWHDGSLTSIGVLMSPLEVTSLTLDQSFGDIYSRISPDGRHLLFVGLNGEGLTGYDHGSSFACGNGGSSEPCMELYLYDADSDELACASCNPSASPVSHANFFGSIAQSGSAQSPSKHQNHPMSDDGSLVFFDSADRLVPEDTNGKRDAYIYDADDGSVSLISSGQAPQDSWFVEATPNGSDVFFLTAERLSGWDLDNSYDLYDARVGGGVSDPPIRLAPCEGDACQTPAVAPDDPTPATSTAGGQANPKPKFKQRKRVRRPQKSKRRGNKSSKRAHHRQQSNGRNG